MPAQAPPSPLPERLRTKAGDAAVWVVIEVIPARMVAWLIHQRCLWRARIRRRAKRTR